MNNGIYQLISNFMIKRNPLKLKFVPDKIFLNLKYFYYFNKKICWNNPTTFNEKIQWLKLNDRRFDYVTLVDKYAVREKVKNIIGEQYLIRLIGVWNSFDEIDFSKLPDRFVLKTTHDSGSVCVCTNKNIFNINEARKILERSMKRNYFYSGREWPYKNIKPKIICEEFIDENGHLPEDYKFMCFNGIPDNVMVCKDRKMGQTKFYFFNMKWELMRCNDWGKKAKPGFTLEKPKQFDEMIKIAKKLSKGIPLARIDLYNINGKIYFGEVTLYPDSGFDNNLLSETDISFGNKLKIERNNNNENSRISN